MLLFAKKVYYICNLGFLVPLDLEDTVVALSATGILKVWIVTSEISGMQVRQMLCSYRVFNFSNDRPLPFFPQGPGENYSFSRALLT